jgi:hypothetical protein
LVFIAKRWAKGFRIGDKYVEERMKYMCICVCTHKKKKIRRKERKKKEKRKERKIKREKDPRQGKKDIMRDDKSSENQEKCDEGCDDV